MNIKTGEPLMRRAKLIPPGVPEGDDSSEWRGWDRGEMQKGVGGQFTYID